MCLSPPSLDRISIVSFDHSPEAIAPPENQYFRAFSVDSSSSAASTKADGTRPLLGELTSNGSQYTA